MGVWAEGGRKVIAIAPYGDLVLPDGPPRGPVWHRVVIRRRGILFPGGIRNAITVYILTRYLEFLLTLFYRM